MAKIYNLGTIQKEMEKIAEQVIKATTKEVLEDFKKYVQEYVYDSHPAPTVYVNDSKDNKFINSWEWTAIEKSATQISTTMLMNPMKMNHTTDSFHNTKNYGIGIHGSRGFGDEDARESMDEILNKKRSSDLWVSVFRPVGYWDKFIQEYVSGGGLKRVIDKHAKANGLTIR